MRVGKRCGKDNGGSAGAGARRKAGSTPLASYCLQGNPGACRQASQGQDISNLEVGHLLLEVRPALAKCGDAFPTINHIFNFMQLRSTYMHGLFEVFTKHARARPSGPSGTDDVPWSGLADARLPA